MGLTGSAASSGPTSSRTRCPCVPQRGSVVARRFCRPSHAASAEQPPALSRRQWAPGARQAARRHRARRLWRSGAAGSLPHARPVLDAAARGGGRECPSGQDRAADSAIRTASARSSSARSGMRSAPRVTAPPRLCRKPPCSAWRRRRASDQPRRASALPSPAERWKRVWLCRTRPSPARAACRAERGHARRRRARRALRRRSIRSEPRGRRSTTPSSSPRPRTRSSSSISTPRMSAWSMSG